VVSLLDINLLIALAWPNHVHHRAALRWFDRNHSDGWATSPQTQSGFVRVSSNAHILPGARSPREALAVLRRIVALPDHLFWQDDISIATTEFVDETKLHGHRQVSDIHLLAVALRNEGRLATLDRGILHLVPAPYAAADVVSIVIDETPS
jgi:toxin-antitoxin system PIN domain toxin